MSEKSDKMTRRQALGVVGGLVAGGVVGAAGGYYAGMTSAPPAPSGPGGVTTVTQTILGTTTAMGAGQFKGLTVAWIGGGAGDPYDTLLMDGAADAQKYLGVRVDYAHTDWDPAKMVQEFSAAIGRHPDGIVCMGHPGYEGLRDLFQQAIGQGIRIMIADTDVPRLRQEFPGVGYCGANLYQYGQTMGRSGLEAGKLKAGDRAAVFSGSWDQPERAVAAQGAYDVLAKAGLFVDKVEHPSSVYDDPSTGVPYVLGYYNAHRDVKLIVFDGGGTTASTVMYMETLKLNPGQITVSGTDITPGSIDALNKGYLQATLEMMPYLQAYQTVLSLCFGKKYGFPGYVLDTTGAAVTLANLSLFTDPSYAGVRY